MLIDMDDFDREILTILQRDAAASVADIANQVGLSTTPCWRRIQNLESKGVIKGRSVRLDPVSLNLGMTVFAEVRAPHHHANWRDRFAEAVDQIPEIVELFRLSGSVDYLMKIVVPDLNTYDEIYRQLVEQVEFTSINSTFVMETVKSTTTLPLDYTE